MRMLRAHLGAYAGSSPDAAGAGYFPLGGTMPKLAVLLIVLLCSIGAMSAYGSGAKDQIDPALTDEVEALLGESFLRDFAGLEPTPILATPIPPASGIGPAFVEIPLIIDDGHVPLSDLDALYSAYGPPLVVPAPADLADDTLAHVAPPADLVDDTPAMIASVWDHPPLDIK